MRAPSPSETPRPHLAPGHNAEYLNSQFCQQEVEIARSIVAATRLVGGCRLDPGRHRRNPHHHAAWIAEGAAALARLYQHHRECHEHGAAGLPKCEAMALGLNGDALDRSRYAGSSQRLSTTEGSQAASSVTCRSGSAPKPKLRRTCSPSQCRLTLETAPWNHEQVHRRDARQKRK